MVALITCWALLQLKKIEELSLGVPVVVHVPSRYVHV